MTLNNKKEQIWQSIDNLEDRIQFIEEEINVGIAFQIRSLRNRQNRTQDKLAELLGVTQPLISEWENPEYGKYTLKTLKDLAKAFDVGLMVRFASFGELVDTTANLTPDIIAPPSFNEEQRIRDDITTSHSIGLAYNETTNDEYELLFKRFQENEEKKELEYAA